MSKYGVTSGPYFPVFSPNTGNYGPEITPYLDTFHAVILSMVENRSADFLRKILCYFTQPEMLCMFYVQISFVRDPLKVLFSDYKRI